MLAAALLVVSTVSVVGAVTRSYERNRFIAAILELSDRAVDETAGVDRPVVVEVDPAPLGEEQTP